MGFVKEVLRRQVALEGYDNDGFDAALAGVEQDREISKATDACDRALNAVVSLENIHRIVSGAQSHSVVDEGKNADLGLITGSITHFLHEAGFGAAVESIDTQTTQVGKYKVATEGLGEWISKIWKAIVDFLNRIWTWVKSLFGGNKTVEDTQKKTRVYKDLGEYTKALNKDMRDFTDSVYNAIDRTDSSYNKQINKHSRPKLEKFIEDYEKVVRSGGGKKEFAALFDARNIPKSVVSKKDRQPIKDRIKTGRKIATESDKSIAESVVTVLSEIGSFQPCFQSGESYFLVDSKAVARGTADHKAVAETVAATADTVNGFNYGLDHTYIKAIEDAAHLLSGNDFSVDTAGKIISVLCPTAQKLNASIRNVGTVQNNVVILTGTVSTKTIGFSCVDSTEGLVKAFVESGHIGNYLTQIAFRTTSDLAKSNEPPLIELCPSADCVNHVIEASDDLFMAYNDMHTTMYHFDKAITALQRAIDQVQKNEAVASNTYAANFARIALHSVSCYITQPVKHLNNMTPKVLEAIEAFTRNSVICLNPATALRYI